MLVGEVCYRPLIEDMTWSYSRITCFDDCPYRWFMKYILGTKEEPRFYASYGSFMHKLHERYYKGEITKEEMKTKFLFDFSSQVAGRRPSERTVASYIDKGVNYLDNFKELPYELVAAEDTIHFNLDGIPFIAIVDYVGKDENGFIVVDNKSRELKPRSNRKKPTKNDLEIDEMLKQLYIYAEAIKSKYGEYPTRLCFNCFKNQQFIEEQFDEEKCKETAEWVKKKIASIESSESGDFYPNVEFFGCYYLCGYSDECCYWEGRDR